MQKITEQKESKEKKAVEKEKGERKSKAQNSKAKSSKEKDTIKRADSAFVCRFGFILFSACVPFGFCVRLNKNGSRCVFLQKNLWPLAKAQVLELPLALALWHGQLLWHLHWDWGNGSWSGTGALGLGLERIV